MKIMRICITLTISLLYFVILLSCRPHWTRVSHIQAPVLPLSSYMSLYSPVFYVSRIILLVAQFLTKNLLSLSLFLHLNCYLFSSGLLLRFSPLFSGFQQFVNDVPCIVFSFSFVSFHLSWAWTSLNIFGVWV